MGLRSALGLKPPRFDYDADGMTLSGKNLALLDEPVFLSAFQKAADAYERSMGVSAPDTRFRAHVCLQAARQALLTEGDFVECGVATGMASLTICHALDFSKVPRTFWLFDTFQGVPLEGLAGEEKAFAKAHNDKYYPNVYESTKEAFSPFPNAKLIRGALPGTLSEATGPIAYLSIDLNSKTYEMQVIEKLWPRVSRGGVIVLDDYGFKGHDDQQNAWDDFAKSVNHPVIFLPTGQGLIVKNTD